MRRIWGSSGLAVAALGAGLLSACEAPQPWTSELASVNAAGTNAGNGPSNVPEVSPDGTKVVFQSTAGNLGPTDTNGRPDVYLRDLTTGTTTLVSTNISGTGAAANGAESPVFSPDGTKVAFRSFSDDLVPGDSHGMDIFVYDLTSGEIRRVSSDDPFEAWNLDFSPDSQRMVFAEGGNLYLHDLSTGTSTLLTERADGTPSHGDSYNPEFSPDGTKVAFYGSATDLGPVGDTNGSKYDVFIHDLATSTTSLVTAGGSWDSNDPVFSPDGTKVAFLSYATNLGPTDTNNRVDVYLRDLVTGATTLVSANAAGSDSGNGPSGDETDEMYFTPDGTGLVFSSLASNLGPTDTNGDYDVFLRNLTTGGIDLLSVNVDGSDSANGFSRAVGTGLGAGGTRVLFVSSAHDLVAEDTNGELDVFVHDLATGVTTLVSANAARTDSGNGPSDVGSEGESPFSADGHRVAIRSEASNLGATDTNGEYDIYVVTLASADLAVTLAATPDPVPSGGTVTYELGVANGGIDPAEAVKAALQLPAGTTFTGVTTTAGTCSPPAATGPAIVVCTFGDAPVGAIATVTVTADVTAAAGSDLTAGALVTSATADEIADNNRAEVTTEVS